MRNLKAAGAALGDAILGGTVFDGLEEIGTDRGRHIVLFLLEAVTAGNAAAAGTGVLDVGGSHAEQIKARLADALRAQVAGGMIDIDYPVRWAAELKDAFSARWPELLREDAPS